MYGVVIDVPLIATNHLRDEQIDCLFEKANLLTWPPKSYSGINADIWWKCAIILYRTYGFRTQELLAYESIKNPLTWSNISFSKDSPNPASIETNQFGWLYYTPPKTRQKKPDSIYLPLTKYTKAVIDCLNIHRFDKNNLNEKLFKLPFSQIYEYLSNHKHGLATIVCRWGQSNEAQIASKHYISNDIMLRELLIAPMPISFDKFLLDYPCQHNEESADTSKLNGG